MICSLKFGLKFDILSDVCCGVNPVLLLRVCVCAQGQSGEQALRSRAEVSHRGGEKAGRVDPKLYAAGSPDV